MLHNKQILIITCAISLSFLLFSSLSFAKALRDPTLPGKGYAVSSTQVNRPGSLVLNSIMHSNKPHAVINNKILFVGDRVEGVRIEYIGKQYVNLADGRKLTLFQSITER